MSNGIKLREFHKSFYEGLQYNAPARGVWNIVHTGMLIPDSHQVYICAQGCLRGVILTAAEMNEMERMSWVALREEDMWNGEMESRVIEGTAHIVDRMKKRPRCVLIYLSCMHMFEGCDFQMITDELSAMYPDIDFVECYMIPTMRKTMSPDSMMKISLYESVKKQVVDDDLIGVIGSNLPIDKTSDICELVKMSGRDIWDITECKNYDEYLALGSASRLVSFLSVSDAAGKQLAGRLDRQWLRIPLRFDEKKLDENLHALGKFLGLPESEVSVFTEEKKRSAYSALDDAKRVIGDTEIAIDYTAYPYVIELAEMLLNHGLNVTRIYTDTFNEDEKDACERIMANPTYADIEVCPTLTPDMRFAAAKDASNVKNISESHESDAGQKILAIGQKAAYFENTPYFVDIVEGGGSYGYQAIERLADLMIDAFNNPKDTKKVISHKGWGCDSCL